MNKQAIVVHSGGMDSSICLALAMREFSKESVLSLSFSYDQRHSAELRQAAKICQAWHVDHAVISLECLKEITDNALINPNIPIKHLPGRPPNTLVTGRNGLMARLGAIHANHLGAHCIYMGVIGLDGSCSGYRDCSRDYMDMEQQVLRMDLDDPKFEIRTPLVFMSKKATMELAYQLGVLEYLLRETISCYEGIPRQGCGQCPACILRNEGIRQFLKSAPEFVMPYKVD